MAKNAQVSTASGEAFKLREVKQVNGARRVTRMEGQLLIAGQARYAYTAKSALVERL